MTNPNAIVDKSTAGTKAPVPLLAATSAMWKAELDGRGIAHNSHYAIELKKAKRALASGDAQVIPRITREALRRELGTGWLPSWDSTEMWNSDDIIAALKRCGVEVGE